MNIFKCPEPQLICLWDNTPLDSGASPSYGNTKSPRSHMGQPSCSTPALVCADFPAGMLIFFIIFIPEIGVNCLGPGGVTCQPLSEPESPGLKWGCDRFLWGVTSETMSQLPPTMLGTEDENVPFEQSENKEKAVLFL